MSFALLQSLGFYRWAGLGRSDGRCVFFWISFNFSRFLLVFEEHFVNYLILLRATFLLTEFFYQFLLFNEFFPFFFNDFFHFFFQWIFFIFFFQWIFFVFSDEFFWFTLFQWIFLFETFCLNLFVEIRRLKKCFMQIFRLKFICSSFSFWFYQTHGNCSNFLFEIFCLKNFIQIFH